MSKSNYKTPISNESIKKTPFNIPKPEVTFYKYYPYFSFRFYDYKHKKYSAQNIDNKKDFITLLEKLHKISHHTWKDIFTTMKEYYHAHEINWSNTEEKSGFIHVNEEYQNFPAYQFKTFKECRILGFFNEANIFNIVWIDRDHQICPDRNR